MHQFSIKRAVRRFQLVLFFAAALVLAHSAAYAQGSAISKAENGSRIARSGFRNEDEIKKKFEEWQTDADAREWLREMNYTPDEIAEVLAIKPHGEKADVSITLRMADGAVRREGISIKLVSSAAGFNQIDKRWLRQYARAWSMSAAVESALALFLGETPPTAPTRDKRRTYLNELDAEAQQNVVRFFTENKEKIVTDLLRGSGDDAADWLLVAWKNAEAPRWKLVSMTDALRFFGEGKVEVTRAGNLKIGRITMQRKGGDGGRETAKMLQFKINPVQLIGAN